jgi:WD40 repeat protein
MDRQRLVILLLASLAACGDPSVGKRLAPGQIAKQSAISLQRSQVLGKNALAYQVAIDAPYLASVELTTAFELVLRALPDGPSSQKTSPRRIRLDAATYDINDLLVDAQGHRAFVASSAGWVRSYDLKSLQMQSEWRMGSGATALAMSADRQYLLIGTETGVICLRRLSDGAQLQCMAAHQGRVSSLELAQDQLASATWGGEVALWELPSLRMLSTLETRGSVADLAFSPDGSWLAVARNQRPPIRTQAINDAEKKSTKPDPVGVHLIELYGHGTGELTDTPRRTLAGHRSIISSLAWIGGDLLSGSWDRSVQLWSAREGSRSGGIGDFKHIIRDLAVRAEGGSFAVASWGTENDAPALSWGYLRY